MDLFNQERVVIIWSAFNWFKAPKRNTSDTQRVYVLNMCIFLYGGHTRTWLRALATVLMRLHSHVVIQSNDNLLPMGPVLTNGVN